MPTTSSTCFWSNTLRSVEFWSKQLKALPFICRSIKYGVYEKPLVTPSARTRFRLPQIPVPPELEQWPIDELAESLERKIFEELPPEVAEELHNKECYPIFNVFIANQDRNVCVL